MHMQVLHESGVRIMMPMVIDFNHHVRCWALVPCLEHGPFFSNIQLVW